MYENIPAGKAYSRPKIGGLGIIFIMGEFDMLCWWNPNRHIVGLNRIDWCIICEDWASSVGCVWIRENKKEKTLQVSGFTVMGRQIPQCILMNFNLAGVPSYINVCASFRFDPCICRGFIRRGSKIRTARSTILCCRKLMSWLPPCFGLQFQRKRIAERIPNLTRVEIINDINPSLLVSCRCSL
jgi:hypothetical protein